MTEISLCWFDTVRLKKEAEAFLLYLQPNIEQVFYRAHMLYYIKSTEQAAPLIRPSGILCVYMYMYYTMIVFCVCTLYTYKHAYLPVGHKHV